MIYLFARLPQCIYDKQSHPKLLAAGLFVLDQAGQAQTNASSAPFDRVSASRRAIARSNPGTAPNDTASEFMASASIGGNCRDTKGNFVEVFSPQTNVATGAISNAGWLNGATQARLRYRDMRRLCLRRRWPRCGSAPPTLARYSKGALVQCIYSPRGRASACH